MIYCIFHERSLNKVVPHLKALGEFGERVILITECQLSWMPKFIPVESMFSYTCDLTDINDINSIISKVGTPSFIFTVSENLLPLVADLEGEWGLPLSMPRRSAEILSDKYLFLNFLDSNGFSEILPEYRMLNRDFFSDPNWDKKPFLIKPTVGSGSNIYYKNAPDDPVFEYRRYDSKDYLKRDLLGLPGEELEKIFSDKGVKNPRFAQLRSRFLVEEYIVSDKETVDYQGMFVNGKHFISSVSHVGRESENLNVENNYSREKFCWFGPVLEEEVLKQHKAMVNKILTKLEIVNMIYSGPSYYKTSTGLKILDFNPRVSGGYGLISNTFNLNLVGNFWSMLLYGKELSTSFFGYFYWGVCNLKPGRVGKVRMPEFKTSNIVTNANQLVSGYEISNYQSLQTKEHPFVILTNAETIEEAKQKYQLANNLIQSGIEYED